VIALAFAWVAVLGLVVLAESRRHDRRHDDLTARVVVLDETVADLTGQVARLHRDMAELRDWRAPHLRRDHEPAVARLLDGEHDASARRGTS